VLALGGVPWNDLDDGVQQVQLKLVEHQAKHGSSSIRNAEAWAAVVASRVAIDWRRRRAREAGLTERLSSSWPNDGSVGGDDRMLALTIAAALETLPLAQRQAITLRYYVDLSIKDIAELLEVPEGTIKSRIHTAMESLRLRLSEGAFNGSE